MEVLENDTVPWKGLFEILPFPTYVIIWTVACFGLPLIAVTICALLFLVRKDHVVPIYIINLLISDVIQICCSVIMVTTDEISISIVSVHLVSLMTSVGFMVCIALERYLVIARPLWYRFKKNIRFSALVCVAVWLLPVAIYLSGYIIPFDIIIYFTFFLLPFPVLIFSLVGTLRSLSVVVSVSSEEKRRIVGTLVLVLLIYSVFFLPLSICLFIVILWPEYVESQTVQFFNGFVLINPLTDLILYVFMGKGATEKLLIFLCCRKKDEQQQQHTVREQVEGENEI